MKNKQYFETFGLFDDDAPAPSRLPSGANTEKLTRLDIDDALKEKILPYCRLKAGGIWEDPVRGHRVGVLDACSGDDVGSLFGGDRAALAVNDPPYNVAVGNKNTGSLFKKGLDAYLDFSRAWIQNTLAVLADDASFYLWIGMDYKDGFQPMPDLIIMLREFGDLRPRNVITVRNQRGFGTQKNWMWVRQELLYYIKGDPVFNVDAEYTDIPKILRTGYYKSVDGKVTDNMERSRSETIRAGNVWVDIQQVFYRMEENVPGCYAQKPLKSIERIVASSTADGDLVADFFSHSGTTLIAGERLGRRVYTLDNDPIFAEISIRRLENLRKTGRLGWQWNHPFPEVENI